MSELISEPSVSICVITYNQKNYIRACLQSLVDQDVPAPFEIIVGDDCSTDGTKAIVQEFAERYPEQFVTLLHPANLGGCENYRRVHRMARGQYVAHVDGDDYWMPEKLSAQLGFFREHPKCAAVYTNAQIVNESGNPTGVFNNRQPSLFDASYLLRRGNFLNSSSMLYRADFKQALLNLKGDFIDYRVHLRLAQFGKLGYINRCLVAYRAGSINSAVSTIPDMVRDLYWEALCDPDVSNARDANLISGTSDFYARILLDSIKRGRISYAAGWAARVWRQFGLRALQIFSFSIAISLSMACRFFGRKIDKLTGRRRIQVMSER